MENNEKISKKSKYVKILKERCHSVGEESKDELTHSLPNIIH